MSSAVKVAVVVGVGPRLGQALEMLEGKFDAPWGDGAAPEGMVRAERRRVPSEGEVFAFGSGRLFERDRLEPSWSTHG